MENILVSDVMTRDPIIIKPSTSVLEAAKKMVQKKVGSLLIVDKKRLVGFIAEKDILWALTRKRNQDLSQIKVIDISPRKIATIRPNANLKEALSKMKKLKFQRLPVIQNTELMGLITIKDILTFNPEIYPELEEFSKIREESNKLKRIEKAKKRKEIEGVCEECGTLDILTSVNGALICDSCKNSL